MNYYNYFTEIEEHFVRRRGKHLLISPMDWSLIATWREAGVPLHVALRGIDRAMDSFVARRGTRPGKVNSLFYCHDTVMEEFARHVEAHTGETANEDGPSADSPASEAAAVERATAGRTREAIVEFLRAKISELAALEARLDAEARGSVRGGVERVRARLEEIAAALETAKSSGPHDEEALERDLSILDEALVTELAPAVGAEARAAWEEEAKAELKIYRKRLPKETYGKIFDNFIRRKVHHHFEVGELSLFHL